MIYPMPKAAPQIAVWAGTRKGAFAFRSRDRKTWKTEGPFFRGMEVHHLAQDPREPNRLYAAVNSAWFGAHIHASEDGGKSWKLSEAGLEVKSLPETSLKCVWHIEPGAADEPGVVYAGGDPGVLFRSGDWGRSWEEVVSLNTHATRSRWNPGAGGMCLHSIQCLGGGRMIVAISAAGAFRTADGGATWTPFNQNVRADFQPDKYPEVGQCVHKLLAHPRDSEALYQQNHCGVYRARLNSPRPASTWARPTARSSTHATPANPGAPWRNTCRACFPWRWRLNNGDHRLAFHLTPAGSAVKAPDALQCSA